MSLAQTVRTQGESLQRALQGIQRIERALRDGLGIDVLSSENKNSNLENLILKMKAYTAAFGKCVTARDELLKFALQTNTTGKDLQFVAERIGSYSFIVNLRNNKTIFLIIDFLRLLEVEKKSLDQGLFSLSLDDFKAFAKKLSEEEELKIRNLVKTKFTKVYIDRIADQAIDYYKKSQQFVRDSALLKGAEYPPPTSAPNQTKKSKKAKKKEEKAKKDQEQKHQTQNQQLPPPMTPILAQSSSSSSSMSAAALSVSPLKISSPTIVLDSPRNRLESKISKDSKDSASETSQKKRKSITLSGSTSNAFSENFTESEMEQLLADYGQQFQPAKESDEELARKKREQLPSDISDNTRKTEY